MKTNLCFAILVLLFNGCISVSSLSKKGSGFELTPNKTKIKSTKIQEWKVGNKKQVTLSRGFQVKLSIPVLGKKEIEELSKKFDIDSGIIQIRRQIRGTTIPVGSMLIPIDYLKKGKAKDLYFRIIYYAASIRPSFTKYACVPFNQAYKLGDIDILKRPSSRKSLTIASYEEKSFKDVILPFQYNNQSFTGGKYLKGEYFFRFALFDSRTSRLKSSFYDYQQKVSVEAEDKEYVPGCESYRGDGLLKKKGRFKWKK